MSAPWLREEVTDGQEVIQLTLHVQPGAKRTGVEGTYGDALKFRLAAPPVDGKANAELLRYIANAFGVPQRNVILVRGDSSRHKVVRVSCPTLRPDAEWG